MKIFYTIIFSILFFITPVVSEQLQIRVMVYPFANMGDAKQSWIGFGLTELINTDLIKISNFTMIDEDMRKFAIDKLGKGKALVIKDETLAKLGKLLKVNFIVSGYYTLDNSKLKVTIILLSPKDGKIIKNLSSEGDLKDAQTMMNQVSLDILKYAHGALVEGTGKTVFIKEPDIERVKNRVYVKHSAFELYAKGVELRETDPKKAMEMLLSALKIEPEYVEALEQAGRTTGIYLKDFTGGIEYLEKANAINIGREKEKKDKWQ